MASSRPSRCLDAEVVSDCVENIATSRSSNVPPELINCGICEEPYDDGTHKAKFLECHHTFCSDCLAIIANMATHDTHFIRCPNCRSHTRLPEDGVAGLQTNFYASSMQETSEKNEHHKVVTHKQTCHKHCDQPKSFFCETCRTSICRDCTVLDHKNTAGHTIISIGEGGDVLRCMLEGQLKLSNTTRTQIQGAIEQIDSEVHTLRLDKDSAIKDLTSFIQFAQQQLQQCQQQATDAILQNHETRHGKLIHRQRQLKEADKRLKNDICQSKGTLKTGDINDIITSIEKLEMNSDTEDIDFPSFNQIRNSFRTDLITGQTLFNDSLFHIGKACFQSFLPTSVEIKSDGATAESKSIITLELVNDMGNTGPFAPSLLAILITDLNQTVVPVTLSTSHPECTVIFTPTSSGRHGISVWYMGQKLRSEQTHIMVDDCRLGWK